MGIKSIYQKINNPYKKALKQGLKAGTGVSVMGGVNFGSEPWLITIGDCVRLSFNVTFITHDGGTWAFRDLNGYQDVIRYGKIYIGAHSFIGANTIIMPGVTIGERCVIGAGSVVTHDIPDGMVAVGSPARIIKTTMEYAEKCLKESPSYDMEAYRKDKRAEILRVLEK